MAWWKHYVHETLSSNQITFVISFPDLENYTLLILLDVIEGRNAEIQICDYVDSLMTAINPIEGPVYEWEMPNVINPCKKRLIDMPKEDLEQDYIDLANINNSVHTAELLVANRDIVALNFCLNATRKHI